MVAIDNRLRENGAMDVSSMAPEKLANQLVDSADADWLRELVDALDREVRTQPLHRLTKLWNLSNAGAGRLFGVSRQAFAKWLTKGPPPDRAADVASVSTITDLLDRYVKRERIPAVVRRAAPLLGDRSIVDAIEAGAYEETANRVRAMLDLRRVQP